MMAEDAKREPPGIVAEPDLFPHLAEKVVVLVDSPPHRAGEERQR